GPQPSRDARSPRNLDAQRGVVLVPGESPRARRPCAAARRREDLLAAHAPALVPGRDAPARDGRRPPRHLDALRGPRARLLRGPGPPSRELQGDRVPRPARGRHRLGRGRRRRGLPAVTLARFAIALVALALALLLAYWAFLFAVQRWLLFPAPRAAD